MVQADEVPAADDGAVNVPSSTPVSGDAMELVERLRKRTYERSDPAPNGWGYVKREHPDPLCQKAADEIERLSAELDASTVAVQTLDAVVNNLNDECERLRSQGGAPEGWASLYVGDGQFAICDWGDWTKVRGYWWRLSTANGPTRYAQAHSSHDTKTRHRVTMHGLIMEPQPGQSVDHIDGNGLDNRRSNLRLVTHKQNMWNQRGHGGESEFKGVSFRKDTGVWRANITVDGKRKSLGTFASEVDAARAYNAAAREAFGEYAKLNDVD